jgi:hypothetical protein
MPTCRRRSNRPGAINAAAWSRPPAPVRYRELALTNTLKNADIGISMDGRGRWMDNVFIERLWRALSVPERVRDRH